ncbi:hypothetical protein HYPSUDRAFT_909239 [Hypholoma sublateritium FD-334 SS-4]|uniref:Uncharacterized protein n=1 Tax=Hypholoma sublateritium (strain FD-334 SS-4) TaxID=945553 RepID=A0A0D2KWL3_HYPSF|nr:hypothetical protein HYPSUDRAFT_909239 [Hypholoma sublateritium FD-334 SS-4]
MHSLPPRAQFVVLRSHALAVALTRDLFASKIAHIGNDGLRPPSTKPTPCWPLLIRVAPYPIPQRASTSQRWLLVPRVQRTARCAALERSCARGLPPTVPTMHEMNSTSIQRPTTPISRSSLS